MDTFVVQSSVKNYPNELLFNSLDPSKLSPHKLDLKAAGPIMLLRNRDPPKLCNVSGLVVRQMRPHHIEAIILL